MGDIALDTRFASFSSFVLPPPKSFLSLLPPVGWGCFLGSGDLLLLYAVSGERRTGPGIEGSGVLERWDCWTLGATMGSRGISCRIADFSGTLTGTSTFAGSALGFGCGVGTCAGDGGGRRGANSLGFGLS